MLILNHLVLLLVVVALLAFLLIDICIFYVGITIIIEDIKKEKNKYGKYSIYIIISTLLKVAAEIVVLIIGYLILYTLIEVIDIMMKGGNIQW